MALIIRFFLFLFHSWFHRLSVWYDLESKVYVARGVVVVVVVGGVDHMLYHHRARPSGRYGMVLLHPHPFSYSYGLCNLRLHFTTRSVCDQEGKENSVRDRSHCHR
jgi:hypothetical protein